jgi:hypothetical protein
MEKWKKVGNFAGGVIYACGNKRRIVSPGLQEIHYEINAQDVRWSWSANEDGTRSPRGSHAGLD